MAVRSTVEFKAQSKGLSITKDGVLFFRLIAPYSETGNVLRLTMRWTKTARFVFQTKRTVQAVLKVHTMAFRADGQSVVVLTTDARSVKEDIATLAGMKQREIAVTASWSSA